MKPDFWQQAKEFMATYGVKLSDTQWNVARAKLAKLLEYNYTLGQREGAKSK